MYVYVCGSETLKLGKAGNDRVSTTQRHCPVSVDQAIYTCVRTLIGGLPGARAQVDSDFISIILR